MQSPDLFAALAEINKFLTYVAQELTLALERPTWGAGRRDQATVRNRNRCHRCIGHHARNGGRLGQVPAASRILPPASDAARL